MTIFAGGRTIGFRVRKEMLEDYEIDRRHLDSGFEDGKGRSMCLYCKRFLHEETFLDRRKRCSKAPGFAEIGLESST